RARRRPAGTRSAHRGTDARRMTQAALELRGRFRQGTAELAGTVMLTTTLAIAGRMTGATAVRARLGQGNTPANGLLEGVHGEFAALAWDAERRRGWLIRDQLGARDVFYAAIPGGIA